MREHETPLAKKELLTNFTSLEVLYLYFIRQSMISIDITHWLRIEEIVCEISDQINPETIPRLNHELNPTPSLLVADMDGIGGSPDRLSFPFQEFRARRMCGVNFPDLIRNRNPINNSLIERFFADVIYVFDESISLPWWQSYHTLRTWERAYGMVNNWYDHLNNVDTVIAVSLVRFCQPFYAPHYLRHLAKLLRDRNDLNQHLK